MEQYYQREGRDWERYAWIKARPVAGDIVAGKRLIQMLRPFIYRRYLDYTAFAGLREMKALIDTEVARKDLSQHLKLGPGGIREIEFIVQLLQLIRGGREPSLRENGLLPALAACERIGALSSASAKVLRESYRFLRRLENRVQMLRDEQTHDLPNDAFDRERLARSMNHADWQTLAAETARVRAAVSEEFASVLAPVQSRVEPAGDSTAGGLWQHLLAGESQATELAALGFENADALHAQLAALIAAPAARSLTGKTQIAFRPADAAPHRRIGRVHRAGGGAGAVAASRANRIAPPRLSRAARRTAGRARARRRAVRRQRAARRTRDRASAAA